MAKTAKEHAEILRLKKLRAKEQTKEYQDRQETLRKVKIIEDIIKKSREEYEARQKLSTDNNRIE
jgi:hypothetical protein